ncbi:amidase domain-containing protein [Clostridium neuense]|uniref:Amidase domain-containing protein n=1 Tax=Clostridium neuense TaxID=1728934 RepID=A0ABW8TCI2_9CLOT
MLRQNKYLRFEAVSYALTYALTPNPKYRYFQLIGDNGGDCTNFISQCLLAGGAKMNYGTSWSWWYNIKNPNNVMDDTWSVSWAVAHSLYYYLRNNEEINSPYTKGLEISNVKDLELGDLIFYEDNNKKIFHSTIITSIMSGVPLVSQHTPEAVNIYYKNSWKAQKYHYVKIIV